MPFDALEDLPLRKGSALGRAPAATASTSDHVTGVETIGTGVARTE